ncbi:aminodeoxychorismate/anthranilate synthase component II [Parvularcula sp. IMCC14364]|uniref:anthranilate synthase component II n=1 Tax=Parvularcula sp. IMCC14364 TaxID=3067902 RepID=UPI002741FE49|nr:aminodeoxychorismate/anthranilate synthase component II [Parvularcula sp. IMCC14364]
MILVIDNYDSFTYNLVHLIGEIEPDIVVYRNDSISPDDVFSSGAQAIVLSPGPCTPDKAGICLEVARTAIDKSFPLLGVCLGHQSIAQACGGEIVRAPNLMHGKTSRMRHTETGIFEEIRSPFEATRYHSLAVNRQSLPEDIEVTAESEDDNEIMALKVKGKPVFGLQFHPESIATQHGVTLVRNFLNAAV